LHRLRRLRNLLRLRGDTGVPGLEISGAPGESSWASLLLIRQAAESRHLSFTALQTVIDLLHKEDSPRATPPEEV
jgi:hypothetical protein